LCFASYQSAVNRGPDNWPGASTIIDLQGNVIDLRHARNRRKRLKNGMTVLRHTVNGDLVLYGRQPSLQKWSLIGAEVYAVFGNTFRIHMNGTPSQNADCDGDEESIYFPQTVDADAEIRSFMCAPNLILNSKASAYFGAVQDQLLGAYVCSDRSIFHSRAQVMTAAAEMQETRVMQTPQPAIMMRDPETGAWREMWTGMCCLRFWSG
jgi:DNA-directed RNA polymerase beta' subunit